MTGTSGPERDRAACKVRFSSSIHPRSGSAKIRVKNNFRNPCPNTSATYQGQAPSAEKEAHLHHLAHEECFIAKSIKTDVRIGT